MTMETTTTARCRNISSLCSCLALVWVLILQKGQSCQAALQSTCRSHLSAKKLRGSLAGASAQGVLRALLAGLSAKTVRSSLAGAVQNLGECERSIVQWCGYL